MAARARPAVIATFVILTSLGGVRAQPPQPRLGTVSFSNSGNEVLEHANQG